VESEWDTQQAGWMLALATYEAGRCPACGGDRAECWAPENEGGYVVPDPMRCHRATALARKQKEYLDQPDYSALMWRAELRG
jgi:hypothetical protein